jgi:hypothetical protein
MNSTKQMTVYKATKELVCEASSLEGFYAMPGETLLVQSDKTGMIARFEMDCCEKDPEGDVLCWHMRPDNLTLARQPGLRGWTLVVLND